MRGGGRESFSRDVVDSGACPLFLSREGPIPFNRFDLILLSTIDEKPDKAVPKPKSAALVLDDARWR